MQNKNSMLTGVILVGLMTTVASAGMIYENSLQDGPDSAWTVTRGSWSWTEQGVSNAKHTENRIFLALPDDFDCSEGYQVSFSAMLDQGQGWGFFFNSELDDSNKVDGFTFQYDPGYAKGAYLLRNWKNDREGCVKAVKTPLDYGVLHDFTFDIQANSLTVFQDGNQIFSYDGALPVSGSELGFRTWSSSETTFQDLSVSSCGSVPEPGTVMFLLIGLGLLKRSSRA